MNRPIDSNSEIIGLLDDESTPALLRAVLQILAREDAKIARDVADKVDELCERRLARSEDHTADVLGSKFSPGELNDRCDAVTGRIMKYLGKLVAENQRTGESSLVLVAAARSLICTSVSLLGVEDGLRDATLVFSDAMRELAPILREMPEMGGQR